MNKRVEEEGNEERRKVERHEKENRENVRYGTFVIEQWKKEGNEERRKEERNEVIHFCQKEVGRGWTDKKNQQFMHFTVFVEAVGWGNVKLVEAMLQGDNPVDMNYVFSIVYGEDTTALIEASEQGDVAMVQTLLHAGASMNLQCCQKWTALHATCDGSQNIKVVEELLKAGADTNMTDVYGESPLLLLCLDNLQTFDPETPQPMDKIARILQIARLLLEAKCNVNQKADMGMTAISWACSECLEEIVPCLLVEHGAIIPPDTFLQLKNKSLEEVVFLIKHGLNVNAQHYKGFTALHFVLAGGRVDLV